MQFFFFILILFSANSFAQNLEYKSGNKLATGMKESSGLVIASDTSFYTINDSGNEPYLFEVNLKGKLIRKIKIEAKNYDWEDLAKDEEGDIYIGDFGNNGNNRKKLRILRIDKRDLIKSTIKPLIHEFTYPDQKKFPPEKWELYYDCEGFIIKGRYAYLFTKNRTEPFDGISKVYKIEIDAGRTSIQQVGEIQLCNAGWYPCSVTSASYNHETGQLVLLTYAKILIFDNFDFDDIETNKYKEIPLGKIEQFEAICNQSKDYIYLTSEKHKILGGNKLYKAKIKN